MKERKAIIFLKDMTNEQDKKISSNESMNQTSNLQKYVCLPKKIYKHLKIFSESDLKIYLTLLILADPKTGRLFASLRQLANWVGISYRSVNKGITKLQAIGYIKYLPSNNRFALCEFILIDYLSMSSIQLRKSSDFSHEKRATFTSENRDICRSKSEDKNSTFFIPFKNQENVPKCINALSILKNHWGKERDGKGEENPKPMEFIPKTKQEALAYEIAENFGDLKHLSLILFYCKKYPESIIHRAFSETKRTPEHRIKKKKVALFIYLLRKYDQESKSKEKS